MKKLVFRFDIDTHKCIRDGVPRLLALSRKWGGVPFSFFLNCGKAISFAGSLKDMMFKKTEQDPSLQPQMMSALQKLGIKDYLYAALINPDLIRYKPQIQQLLESNCEVGIHGGRNHAIWGGTTKWDEAAVRQEIKWALASVREIEPTFSPRGFASPEWNSPPFLPEILKEEGFSYYADLRCPGREPVQRDSALPLVGVNLVGEPGGVAFFENCRVKGMNDDEIVNMVMNAFLNLDTVILYDHPYYAGLQEIDCLNRIIEKAEDNGIEIVKAEELL